MSEVLTHKVAPNGDITVSVFGQTLLKLSKPRLLKLLSTYLTKEDLQNIHKMSSGGDEIDSEDIKIKTLIKVYFASKRAFFGNRKIQVADYAKSTKEYKQFAKALEIVSNAGVNYETFMKSQVRGLDFVNNGAGAFPKPSQLCTPEAETRLLTFLGSGKQTASIKLTPDDYSTPLKDNKKFTTLYSRLNEGEDVTLQELNYLKEVMTARGRQITEVVTKKIAELKGTEE